MELTDEVVRSFGIGRVFKVYRWHHLDTYVLFVFANDTCLFVKVSKGL